MRNINNKEFYRIVDAVDTLFNEKKEALKESKLLTAAKKEACNNVSMKIAALKDYIDEIKHLNSDNPSLLINFRKRASDISEEIMKW